MFFKNKNQNEIDSPQEQSEEKPLVKSPESESPY
jgi:hypothetical protein